MNLNSITWHAFAVGLVVALNAWADSPNEGGPGLESPQTDPVVEGDPADATAEDVLRALQRLRPFNEVIKPAGSAESARGPVVPLWPEGASMVSRLGRLTEAGGWWVFSPQDDDGTPPLRLLPNSTLDGMVRSTVGAPVQYPFVVSGELTVFEGLNYLLPRFATRSMGGPGDSGPPVEPEQPGPAAAGSSAETEALAADAPTTAVIDQLDQQRPTQEVIPIQGSPATPLTTRSPAAGRSLRPDGSPLVERPGRLIRDGDWWTLVFESDHPDYPEPPIKLLPNKNVELMVQTSVRGTAGLVFVVSGEVTVFRGENYLLTRAARRRVDSGNLTK